MLCEFGDKLLSGGHFVRCFLKELIWSTSSIILLFLLDVSGSILFDSKY